MRSQFRLNVYEHYEQLIKRIDLETELKQCNSKDASEIGALNSDRETFIQKIEQTRDFNLNKLENKSEVIDEANESQLFVKHCFLFTNKKFYPFTFHLVVTDFFMNECEAALWTGMQFYYKFNSILEQNPYFELSSSNVIESEMLIQNKLDHKHLCKIIELAREDLLTIDKLKLNFVFINKIRPEACFLFANVRELILVHKCNDLSLDRLKQTVYAFENVQIKQKKIKISLCLINNCLISFDMQILKPISELNLNSFRVKCENREYLMKSESIRLNEDYFENCEQMQQLILQDLFVKSFRSSASLRNLNVLDLENNVLDKIDSAMFKDLIQLEELNLSRNKIESILSRPFEKLKQLKILRLDKNQIEILDRFIFEGLFKLEKLNLSQNKIEFLRSEVFGGLDGLLELDLSLNQIHTIEKNTFSHFKLIQSIDLSRNPIFHEVQ